MNIKMIRIFALSVSAAALIGAGGFAWAATDTKVPQPTPVAEQAKEAAAPAAATETAAPAEGDVKAATDADAKPDADNAQDAAEGKASNDAAAVKQAEAVTGATAVAAPAAAEEGSSHHAPAVPQEKWSFNGPFGTFDRGALQRGFQVYKQVCSACHSMNRLAYRNLSALGYNEAEIKAIAADVTVQDGPNDEGEMYDRPGRPSDHFKSPFANDQAARAANGGALPPDLSLIVRARADGANYVHALMNGYTDVPAGFVLTQGMHYNKYFSGHQIAMPAPLNEGSVTYEDGTTASVEQMSQDVTTFLTWASEPVMEKRKQTGLKVLIFLFVFSGLMYLTKRKVWKDVH